jgi:hypothetical protein
VDTRRNTSLAAPLTFDPFCTRRLRNCVDGENAAFPDGSDPPDSSEGSGYFADGSGY